MKIFSAYPSWYLKKNVNYALLILLIKCTGLHSRLYTDANMGHGYLPTIKHTQKNNTHTKLKDSAEKTAGPMRKETQITEYVEIIKIKSWS